MDRPNILFFFTDDQRFDTIGALGHPAVITPTLDALVDRGTTLTHAHIPGGTSGAVCMPSRAMLHTGRTLFHIQEQGQGIATEHTTMGEHFRAHGYRTFGTGKWHNGTAAYHRSFTDGGEIMFGGMGDHWNVLAHDYDPTGAYDSQLPICDSPFSSRELRWQHADHITAGKHSTDLFADKTMAFLRETADNSEPFFAYVAFMAPHDPRTMPPEYMAMYDPETTALPKNFMAAHPFDNGALHIRDEELAGFPRLPAETRQHIAEYYAMITHVDDAISRVLALLKEQGRLDNTIVVFAGDNGLAVGQHGLFGKQNMYEHSIRVPLIFAGPGIPQGQRRDAFAYLLDIFPTLCDLTSLPTPETVEGSSLTGVFSGPTASVRDSVFAAYNQLHRAVRTRRHKLIEYVVEGVRTTQLFDLQEDPHELTNLAGDPAYAELLAELRQELFRWRDDWNDRDREQGQIFWDGYEATTTTATP